MTMKTVGIAELKAKLSHHLRAVRSGNSVTVLDRDRPVARIVPYQRDAALVVRSPAPDAPALQDVPLPPPLDIDIDIVELLLEERQVDR